MASVIKIKRSAIQGKAPNTSTISSGEIALNTNDGKLFSTDGVRVFEIGANLSSLSIGSNTNLVFSTTGKLHANNAIANGTITSSMLDKTYLDTAGGTMTGFITLHANPTSPLHASSKQYVDEVAIGLKVSPAARVATTVNLSAVYNNGANGVGATLTSTSNTAFPEIDGITITTTEFGKAGVLVKDQANTAHNGRYNLTTIGNNTTSWVLTRCIFCDQSEEIPGSYVFVQSGNIYEGTAWVAIVSDPATFTVGTDGIIYTQFTGGAAYTFDSGLRLVGSVVSLDVGNLSINATAIDANDFLAIHDVTSNTTIKAKISDVALQGPQGPQGPAGPTGFTSNTKNSNTTSEIILDSWDKDVYLSAKYIVQIKSTTNPNKVQTSEILLVHNGSSTFSTEYAIVAISNTIATITSDIDSGLVRLKVTPTIAGTKMTAFRTSIET